jgi:hypothetical protein
LCKAPEAVSGYGRIGFYLLLQFIESEFYPSPLATTGEFADRHQGWVGLAAFTVVGKSMSTIESLSAVIYDVYRQAQKPGMPCIGCIPDGRRQMGEPVQVVKEVYTGGQVSMPYTTNFARGLYEY